MFQRELKAFQRELKANARTREPPAPYLPLSTYAHLLFLEFDPYGRWEDLTWNQKKAWMAASM